MNVFNRALAIANFNPRDASQPFLAEYQKAGDVRVITLMTPLAKSHLRFAKISSLLVPELKPIEVSHAAEVSLSHLIAKEYPPSERFQATEAEPWASPAALDVDAVISSIPTRKKWDERPALCPASPRPKEQRTSKLWRLHPAKQMLVRDCTFGTPADMASLHGSHMEPTRTFQYTTEIPLNEKWDLLPPPVAADKPSLLETSLSWEEAYTFVYDSHSHLADLAFSRESATGGDRTQPAYEGSDVRYFGPSMDYRGPGRCDCFMGCILMSMV